MGEDTQLTALCFFTLSHRHHCQWDGLGPTGPIRLVLLSSADGCQIFVPLKENDASVVHPGPRWSLTTTPRWTRSHTVDAASGCCLMFHGGLFLKRDKCCRTCRTFSTSPDEKLSTPRALTRPHTTRDEGSERGGANRLDGSSALQSRGTVVHGSKNTTEQFPQ